MTNLQDRATPGDRPADELPATVTLDADAWPATDVLLKAALAVPRLDRVRFVESADALPEIKATVLRLLAADEAAGDFLATSLAGSHDAEHEGRQRQRIGPYRLVGVAGRGGMGTAYLAERDDKAFDRLVVIKLLRHDVSSPRHRRYLEAERRHLAKLEHPNVARLYDGGTTEDGHPYLVIEHVDGLPIDMHCAQHSLTIAVRLRLFLQLCDAVHFAHRHLLIHCDLKPANVLVDGGGVVKLLDFGIARLQSPMAEPTPVGPAVRSPMTPRYASPEQMHGEPLSIATDVYALGVLLFELLAGASPYPATDTPRDLEQAICDLPRPRPSTAKNDARVSPQQPSDLPSTPQIPRPWRRDLDHIVMRAMAKTHDQRYASVEQLVDDIQRCLDHRPVRATPASTIDQGRKFVRRNRLGVTTAFIVASGLIVALVVLASKNRAIEHQRRQAEQTKTFLEDMITGANPRAAQATEAPTVLSMLDRAAESLADGMIDERTEVSIANTLAQAYLDLSRNPRAALWLQHTLARLEPRLGADTPELTTLKGTLAQVNANLSALDDAEELQRQVVASWRQIHGEDHPTVALARGQLAMFIWNQGRHEEAELIAHDALRAGRALLKEDVRLAELLYTMGTIVASRGHFPEAESLLREALELRRDLRGAQDIETAISLNQLATILATQDRHIEAMASWRRALEIYAQVLPDQAHPLVATVLFRLASSALVEHDFKAAEAFARRALSLNIELTGDQDTDEGPLLFILCRVLQAQGRLEEAEAMARKQITQIESRGLHEHPVLPAALTLLAEVLLERGAFEGAKEQLTRAIALQDAILDPENPGRSTPFLVLGILERRAGAFSKAVEMHRRAYALRARALPPTSWLVVQAQAALGASLRDLGHWDEARHHLETANKALLDRFGPDDDRTLRALAHLERLNAEAGTDSSVTTREDS